MEIVELRGFREILPTSYPQVVDNIQTAPYTSANGGKGQEFVLAQIGCVRLLRLAVLASLPSPQLCAPELLRALRAHPYTRRPHDQLPVLLLLRPFL